MTEYNYPADKAVPKQIDLLLGPSGIPTQTSVTVGTSSALLLAAGAAKDFIKITVPATAANGIWIRWDGGTAAKSPPAEYIVPGESATWTKSHGFLIINQINAIASAAIAVSLSYH